MPSSDDEWVPSKENYRPLQRRRKSVVPKAVYTFNSADPTSQHQEFEENHPPLQRRRKSAVPKASTTCHPNDTILKQHEFEDNHPSLQRRRKSVVPKAASTLHSEDSILKQHEFKDNHPPLQSRRKSVSKAASTLHSEDTILKQHHKFEDNCAPLQRRRKSVVPKAASTLHPEDSILKQHEFKDNHPPLQSRRKSVSKAASTLHSEDTILKQQHEFEDNSAPLQRKRKSVVPKAASTLHPKDSNFKQHEFEDNHPPLQSRKSILPKAALKLCPNDPILKQRQEFETELHTYSGDDPLSVWCKYIKWVELNFIKGGKDCHIEHLMEQCLNTLKSNKCYYNDQRFVEIWLKFASMSKNPLKVYKYMYKNDIGCASASFYIAWSWKLEEEGNLIKANEVLKEGMQCKSEPVLKIKSYWSEFKARAESKVMADSEQNKDELKDHSKNCQSVMESEKISVGMNGMQLLPNNVITLKNGNVENTVSLKKMNSSASLGGDYRCFRQSFFVDPRLSIMSRVSSVVEVQQDCENPQIALFEPPDPMKLPMYDKIKVYAGTQEISLEEIRADVWFKRKKTLDNENRIAEQDRLLAEQLEKIKTLQWEIEKLKVEHLKVESKQFVPAPFLPAGSEIEDETYSQVSVSQFQNPSALKSSNSSGDNDGAAFHKTTTEDTKTQSRKTMKNGNAIERELSPILEHNEESYRSSGSSTGVIPFHHQENTFKHLDNKDTLEGSQLPNQSTTNSDSVISETITDFKSLSAAETFEILSTDVDPFDKKHNATLLNSLNLPSDYYGNIKTSKQSITNFKEKDLIQVGDVTYVIDNMIAEGSYGKVFVAAKQNSNTVKSKVAIKVCKHASNWEIYICMTLHRRLESIKHLPDIHLSVMKITSAHRYSNAIIFTNEFSQRGTLLNLVYEYKSEKSSVPELLVMYITLEMLQVISKLHECRIIHADVKPDNVLIRDNISKCDILRSISQKTILTKFIDFGQAIDLTLFKKGTCFKTAFKKDQCIEMKEKKPWVFQLDWYGLLNCIHVLLFSSYMQVKKQADGRWGIQKKFRRYWDQTIWIPLFDELLNIPSCYQEPNIKQHTSRIESKLKQNESDFKI